VLIAFWLVINSVLAQDQIVLRAESDICDNLLLVSHLAKSQEELVSTLAKLLGQDYPILTARPVRTKFTKAFLKSVKKFIPEFDVKKRSTYQTLIVYLENTKISQKNLGWIEEIANDIWIEIQNEILPSRHDFLQIRKSYGLSEKEAHEVHRALQTIDSNTLLKQAMIQLLQDYIYLSIDKIIFQVKEEHYETNTFMNHVIKAMDPFGAGLTPILAAIWALHPHNYCYLGVCVTNGIKTIGLPNRSIKKIIAKHTPLLVAKPGVNLPVEAVPASLEPASFSEIEAKLKTIPNSSLLDSFETLPQYDSELRRGVDLLSLLGTTHYDKFQQETDWKKMFAQLKNTNRGTRGIALSNLKEKIREFQNIINEQLSLFSVANVTSETMLDAISKKLQSLPDDTTPFLRKGYIKMKDRLLEEARSMAVQVAALDHWSERFDSAFKSIATLEGDLRSLQEPPLTSAQILELVSKIENEITLKRGKK